MAMDGCAHPTARPDPRARAPAPRPAGTFARPRARSSPEPAHGAPAGRPDVGHASTRWSRSSGRSSASSGPAATGVLLDPEIGAAQAVVDGSLPAGQRPARGDRGDRLRRARRPRGSAGSSTVGAWPRRSGWVPRPPSCSSTTTRTRPTRPTRSGSSRPSRRTAWRRDLALFIEPLSFSIDPAVPRLDRARRAGGSSSRPPGGSPPSAATSSRPSSRTTRARPTRGAWRDACAELDAASRAAVGAPVGRSRRRDVRGPGPGGLRDRGERRPRRTVGLGRGGDACRRPTGTRSCGRPVASGWPGWSTWSTSSGVAWDARPGPLVPMPGAGRGLVPRVRRDDRRERRVRPARRR